MSGTRTIRRDPISTYLVLSSLLGLCIVALAVSTLRAPNSEADFPWRRPVTGSAFGLICILGIMASSRTFRCPRIFGHQTRNETETMRREEPEAVVDATPQLRGHHPSCGRFSGHMLWIGGEAFCAGCLGLAVGATISLLGAALYFLMGLSLSIGGGEVAFWMGFFGVLLGLLQYHLLDFRRGVVHMLVNVVFVVGAFLLLVGVDVLMRSPSAASYLLALDIFWIFTRIELSRRNHRMICESCDLGTCPLRRRGWI